MARGELADLVERSERTDEQRRARLTATLRLFGQPTIDAVAKLVRDDPFDRGELSALERAEQRLDRLKAFVAATDVKLARRRMELARAGHAAPVDRSANGMRSSREQRATAGREQVCDRLPDVESALTGGRIAAGHVDAIADATARLNDDERARFDEHAASLVDQAAAESVDDFARICHNLARTVQVDEGESKLNEQKRNNRVTHRVDQRTGMHHIHAELDPESGNKVMTAIRATVTSLKHHGSSSPAGSTSERARVDAADPRGATPAQDERDRVIAAALRVVRERAAEAASHDELVVQAFVELVTGARAVDRRIPEISVLIDLATLRQGLHASSICEAGSGEMLSPETIRRLCCDGGILPVVLGGQSEVLDLGRARRLASPAQRAALRAMYSTCVIPGCTVPLEGCEIHHVDEWTGRIGDTDLERLVPVCGHDHHRIHEGGWQLELDCDPARTITLRRPDGSIEFAGPSIQRQPIVAA